MPIYEYRCKECHQIFEEWVCHSGDEDPRNCPVCEGESARIMSNTSFVLNGGGWYVTDYGYKSKDKTGTSANGSGDGPGGGASKSDSAAPAESPAPALSSAKLAS